MTCRAFESAERRMKPSQRKALYADPSLVILELCGPVDFAHSTYYALTRADADASAGRAVRRGQSALIHHREGTVTMTPEARKEGAA